uniref:Uncharacterized protein n=1 Tax=Solanum tuberosum TaxID=4113 RepID=M1BMT2_SOLTU
MIYRSNAEILGINSKYNCWKLTRAVYIRYTAQDTGNGADIRAVCTDIQLVYTKTGIGLKSKKSASLAQCFWALIGPNLIISFPSLIYFIVFD